MRATRALRQLFLGVFSRSSADYWERRYRAGMDSGRGSYGDLARFKAEVLNEFVRENSVTSVVELGCGDGNQLELAQYPVYLGLDVSASAIDLCRNRFAGDSSKSFLFYDPRRTVNLERFVAADLAMSLDVIYHLLEDHVYEDYLALLFSLSRRHVVIYSTNDESPDVARHVRNRAFTGDVASRFPEFKLTRVVKNRYPEQSPADFYFFTRSPASSRGT